MELAPAELVPYVNTQVGPALFDLARNVWKTFTLVELGLDMEYVPIL